MNDTTTVSSPTGAPRRKRFERDSREAERPFVLTERDRALLRHLYTVRYLSADQLWQLAYAEPGADPRAPQAILRRLRKLFDRGYVDRLANQAYHQFDPRTQRFTGGQSFVYGLGNKGAEVVAEEAHDLKMARLDWAKNNREIKWPQIQHTLMVSQVYVTLHLALKLTPNLRLHEWRQGRDLQDRFYYDKDGDYVAVPDPEAIRRGAYVKYSVAPDAYFALTRNDTGQALCFFLEADRSTMLTERFLEKIAAYIHWREHGRDRQRCQGMVDFAVLTVTKSESRWRNLLEAARSVPRIDDEAHAYRFRFAYEELYLETPAQFRERIWVAAPTGQRLSLFE